MKNRILGWRCSSVSKERVCLAGMKPSGCSVASTIYKPDVVALVCNLRPEEVETRELEAHLTLNCSGN